MSELDKAISELVSAFQEIMPVTQVSVTQAKSDAKPVTPDAAYWRQKYMEILALKEALDNRVSEQRVAVLNLQETVAELRERNAKILSDSKSKDARIKELYDNLQRAVLNNEPPKMTTPLGLLPVNSTGMRRLADAYAQIASLYNHRAADQSAMADKNAALQKENDAYEALFRVLAETLREYDPKVKS